MIASSIGKVQNILFFNIYQQRNDRRFLDIAKSKTISLRKFAKIWAFLSLSGVSDKMSVAISNARISDYPLTRSLDAKVSSLRPFLRCCLPGIAF